MSLVVREQTKKLIFLQNVFEKNVVMFRKLEKVHVSTLINDCWFLWLSSCERNIKTKWKLYSIFLLLKKHVLFASSLVFVLKYYWCNVIFFFWLNCSFWQLSRNIPKESKGLKKFQTFFNVALLPTLPPKRTRTILIAYSRAVSWRLYATKPDWQYNL